MLGVFSQEDNPLYGAATTVTTVGYGDVAPNTQIQIMLSAIVHIMLMYTPVWDTMSYLDLKKEANNTEETEDTDTTSTITWSTKVGGK